MDLIRRMKKSVFTGSDGESGEEELSGAPQRTKVEYFYAKWR